jgi:hypothetical protein
MSPNTIDQSIEFRDGATSSRFVAINKLAHVSKYDVKLVSKYSLLKV